MVNYTTLTPYIQAVPIDEGFVDYRKFLGALRAGGFHGSIAYEMCSPLLGGGSMENLNRYATRFLEFVHDFRGRAGRCSRSSTSTTPPMRRARSTTSTMSSGRSTSPRR